MKRLFLLVALLGVAVGFWALSKPVPEKIVPTDQTIAWAESYEAGLENAGETGKPVMVDFYADWCGPCKMLDQRTYADGRVVEAATNWVSVKVDVDAKQELATEYKISSIPTIVFLSPDGEEISRFTGFVPPTEMLEEMETARSKLLATR